MQLPETMNFMHQVDSGYSFAGYLSLSRLSRLTDVLVEQTGQVSVTLKFDSSAGYPGLRGQVAAALQLECQRCLQPMPVEVKSQFKFAFIRDETEIESIPAIFEPYLISGDKQSVINLLEDEILLALPMVTMHEQDCSDFMTRQVEALRLQKEASNPFAVLKALKD